MAIKMNLPALVPSRSTSCTDKISWRKVAPVCAERDSRYASDDIEKSKSIDAEREGNQEETDSMRNIFGKLFHCWGAYEGEGNDIAYAPAQLEIEACLTETRKQSLEQIEAKLRKQDEDAKAESARCLKLYRAHRQEEMATVVRKKQAEYEAAQAIEIDISKDLMKTLQAKETALRAQDAKKRAHAKKQALKTGRFLAIIMSKGNMLPKRFKATETFSQKDAKEARVFCKVEDSTDAKTLAQKDAKEVVAVAE